MNSIFWLMLYKVSHRNGWNLLEQEIDSQPVSRDKYSSCLENQKHVQVQKTFLKPYLEKNNAAMLKTQTRGKPYSIDLILTLFSKLLFLPRKITGLGSSLSCFSTRRSCSRKNWVRSFRFLFLNARTENQFNQII